MSGTIACYPGSFDPVTRGHLDLIRRAASLFQSVVVGVGRNAGKTPLFSADERVALLAHEVRALQNVRVAAFDGLAVTFCREVSATVLLRGIRGVSDFDAEQQMARANAQLDQEIETVFLLPAERYAHVSSRLIKEILNSGGPVERFVTDSVATRLRERLAESLPDGSGRAS